MVLLETQYMKIYMVLETSCNLSMQHNWAFELSRYTLLTVNENSLGVWKDDNFIFLIDSHARNDLGFMDPNGQDVL